MIDLDAARAVADDLRLRAIIPGNPADRGANAIDALLVELEQSRAELDSERQRIASSAYHQRILAQAVENSVKTILTASELFDREGTEIWLAHPNRMLDGRTPRELLMEGSDRPWRLAEALADGAVI